MADLSPEPRARMEKALERAKVVGRRPLFSDVALQMPTWEDGFEAGYAARDVEAEERQRKAVDLLRRAEKEVDPRSMLNVEIESFLRRAVLAVSSTENGGDA